MTPNRQVEFESLLAALVCLKRIAPRTSLEGWVFVQQIGLCRSGARDSVALEMPAHLLEKTELKTAIERCGGSVGTGESTSRWDSLTPMAELYKKVELAPTSKTEEARCFLVIPHDGDALAGKLIDALASLDEWEVRVRSFLEDKREVYFYELRSVNNLPRLPPLGLAGGPFVLACLTEDVFVPPGLTLMLLPDYRLLLPPMQRGQMHIWLPVVGRKVEYRLMRETDRPAESLSRLVLVDDLKTQVINFKSFPGKLTVPLVLRRTRIRKQLRRAAQVIYRVESRASEFGPLLLRLLDHADARIEQLTYFSRSLGEGPNAVIEHYLLADANLTDEETWPELVRFDCPRTLYELGLPLFLPAETDFVPAIDGLLKCGEQDEPFLKRIAELSGLVAHGPSGFPSEGGVAGRLAVVLPESSDQNWKVLHLEDGRPLAKMIALVAQNNNREPIRRAVDITRIDLAAERRNHEERWLLAGQEDANELAASTEAQIWELSEAAAALDSEIKRYAERLKEARSATQPASELVATSIPRSIQEFARRVSEITADLASPQRSWFARVEERQHLLAQIQSDALVLQRGCQQAVDQVSQTIEAGRLALSESQNQLQTESANLESVSNELSASVQEAAAVAAEAETAMQGRRQRLEQEISGLAQRERELGARSQEVDAFQVTVEERERQVQAWQQRLTNRRASLTQRLRQAEQAATEAEAEEQRLKRMEETEIPVIEDRIRRAKIAINEIRNRGVETRYAQLSAQLKSVGEELEKLRDLERGCIQKEELIQRLRIEAERLQHRIAESRREFGKINPDDEQAKVEMLEQAALMAEFACKAATAAQTSLSQARQAAQTAFANGELGPIERRLNELEDELRAVTVAAESARPAARLEQIQKRVASFERGLGELRKKAGIEKPWWKKGWFRS